MGLLNQAPAIAPVTNTAQNMGALNQAPVVVPKPVPAPTVNVVPTVATPPSQMTGKLGADFKTLTGDFSMKNVGAFAKEHPYATTAALGLGYSALNPPEAPAAKKEKAYMRPYENTFAVNPDVQYFTPYSGDSTAERNYFTGGLQALPVYRAAEGGVANLAVGGPVEMMSAANSIGGNADYPQANLQTPVYSNPMMQRPVTTDVISQGLDTNVNPYTGEARMAAGGVADLGDYSDGARLLRGPGDGVSDSIPASIGNRQPARLADGEFVIPARVVSEIGNGSTEAGARKLYAMMDRVQGARKKSIGKDKIAVNSKADRHLPA
jgi:hypothetical protein